MSTFRRFPGVTARPGAPVASLADTSSGLLLRYTFDALVGSIANGATVTSAPATSGSLSLPLATAQATPVFPTLLHAGPNGHAALKATGTQTIGTGDATSGVLIAKDAPVTQVLVIKSIALVGSGDSNRAMSVPNDAGGDGFRAIGFGSTGIPRMSGNDGSTGGNAIATTAVRNTWISVIAVSQAGLATLYVQGVQVATTPTFGAGAIRGIRLFASATAVPGANTYSNAEIAEARLYARSLTAVDAAALHAELATKYAL